jgi:tetratricopeptide (TPR) repeat protein
MKKLITLVIAITLFTGIAAADVVHLVNGGKVEGKITDLGDTLRVEHRYGSITIPKSDVKRIEKKATLKELYEARLEKIDAKDPDARVNLGRWLQEKGWGSQALAEFRKAIELDPDHRAARKALGHVFYEGKWRTESEIMEMRGFVRVDGEWISKEEAARRKAIEERKALAKAAKKEHQEFVMKLKHLLRDVAYGSKKKCDAAYDELITIARKREMPGLEKYAGDVKAYFDRYWTLVRANQKVTTEVRAAMSKLKRPIPTLQTSLGAGTTPVTLQLPELSVVSVKTTVVIPAGRGLP